MTIANFPSSPANGDTTQIAGITYQYDGTKQVWDRGSTGNAPLNAVAEHILPVTNETYDLGSANKKFRDLYLSGNTLNIGTQAISADAGGIVLPAVTIGTGTNKVVLSANADGGLTQTGTNSAGVTAPAKEAGAATEVADMAALIAMTGMASGQTVLVTGLNRIFMYASGAWRKIADMTNDSPTAITGVAGTVTLADDGTATVITAVSTDPEGFPLTWSYAVTTGSLGSTATVTQADNVFTITPSSTEADAGEFSLTFSVTDGATGAVSATSVFTLAFGTWDYPTLDARLVPPAADSAVHDGGSYFRIALGEYVDVSADGNTVIASTTKRYGTTGNYNVGGCYIFVRSGGTWTVQATLQPTLSGATANPGTSTYAKKYGRNACISDDGNTVAFSNASVVPYETVVYTRSGTTWTLEQTIIPAGTINTVTQMYSPSISGDGNTIAIGGYGSNSNAYIGSTGAVFVYTRSGSTWTQQQVLQTTHRLVYTELGFATELSTDGNYLIAGGRRHKNSSGTHVGAAFIFVRSGGTWTEQAKLQPSNLGSDANFGEFVDMSSNGDYVVIGAKQDHAPLNHAGAIYIYHRSGTSWTLQASIDNPSGTQNDQFGLSVSMSGDGDIVVASDKDVGGSTNYGGRMWFYKRVGSTWSLFNAGTSSGFRPASGIPNQWPYDGSISKDGSTVLVGCYNYDGYNQNEGGLWAFKVGNA